MGHTEPNPNMRLSKPNPIRSVLMWARSMMEGCQHLNDLGRFESHMTCVRNFFKEEIMNAKLSVWNNLLLKLKLPSNQ